MGKALILTGFMGAGKSSVAGFAASELGFEALDLDELIEAKAGVPISRIFEKHGESRFRKIETEVLSDLVGRGDVVLATGGGILTRAENLALMRDAVVVNLDASFETIWRRVGHTGNRRPLVRGGEEDLRKLYDARRPCYQAVGLRVDTEGKTPAEVAREVAQLYRGGRPEQDDNS